MKKKRLLIRGMGIVLAVGILFTLLFISSPILEHKDSKEKFYDFYKYADKFDALFFGSSHIFNAVIPMDIWNQNGIASFNMGVSGCRMGMSYWMLRNALEYSNPELVVLDCAYLKDEKASPNKEYNHGAFDAMNHLPTKAKAVFDLFDTAEDRIRYLFPFSLYHNRWNELTKEDFMPISSNNKMGFEGLDSVITAELPEFSSTIAEPVNTVSVDYLHKIISTCQDRDIQILLTFLPYNMNETSLNDAAFVREIASEYGIHYLGPEKFLEILDTSVDFANNYDDNSHLNLSGAYKVSSFLGDYIANAYSLQDHRGSNDYLSWDEMYDLHQKNNYKKLDRQVVLKDYLITLSSCNVNTIIEMQDFSHLLNSPNVNLFRNIGLNTEQISSATDCIMIRENGKDVAYYEDFINTENTLNTILGEINFTVNDGTNSSYSLNGVKIRKINDDNSDNMVSIIVMDSTTNEVISTASFDVYTGGNVSANMYNNASINDDGMPEIVVEESGGGYWSAGQNDPYGEFVEHEACSSKRTNIIPVTPGDQLSYKGNGTSVVHSVVWLDADQNYIGKEHYSAEGQAEDITVPDGAAYAWFASFQYTTKPEKVVLDIEWVLCQSAAEAQNNSGLPQIVVERSSGGYWSAGQNDPYGEFVEHEACSSKRTNIIPVTPGDQFRYKGNGTSVVHSVVWLDASQNYISKEYYSAEGQAEDITVPDGAAYAWFASFQYTTKPEKVVLDIEWILCQSAVEAQNNSGLPEIVVEENVGGYWAAGQNEPHGEFIEHEACSAKRTNIIPVTPGDQFRYKGNGTSVVHSVVWLDADHNYIGKEHYSAEGQAEDITVPDGAAYVWFASFQYTTKPEKVVLNIEWVLCQNTVEAQNTSSLPEIVVEENGGGYWSAGQNNPHGEFIEHEACSSKRTNIISVTPGDQLSYKGNGTSVVQSVVWLDADQNYISKEYYSAEDQTKDIIVPDGAAYAWFASFQYTTKPEKVVLDVAWILCQSAIEAQNTSGLLQIVVEENVGGYWSAGQNNPYGEFIEHEACSSKRTNIIPVTPGDQFRYKGNGTSVVQSVVWLDENQNYIGKEYYSAEEQAEDITAPTGAAYAWFASFQYTTKPEKVVLDIEWILHQDPNSPNKLAGKMIIYDGDSIAESRFASENDNGGGYAEIIAKLTNSRYINYAKGGAHLTSHNNVHSVVDNLSNLPKDGDLYCFEGGINDFWANTPIGEYMVNDSSITPDTSTVCGALEYIFRYCREHLSGKPVCFVIVHNVKNTSIRENANGHTFADYRNAMVEICERYSIPYYDAFSKSGLDGYNETLSNLYLTGNSAEEPDGIHPNADGYKTYYVPQLVELFNQIILD